MGRLKISEKSDFSLQKSGTAGNNDSGGQTVDRI